MRFLRTVVGTLALCGAVVTAGESLAAEIKQPQPPFNVQLTPAPAVVARPVEFGSGWYVRGSLGFSQDSTVSLVSGFVAPDQARPLIGVGFGYKQNNWMRYDATLDYNRPYSARRAGAKVVCPYDLYLVEAKDKSEKFGYLWDAEKDTCSTSSVGTLQKADFLGNFYIDLGTWSRITPYVGAGIGISVLRLKGGIEFRKTSNGQLYSANLKPGADFAAPHRWVDAYGNEIRKWTDVAGVEHIGNPPVAFEPQNWSTMSSTLKFNPAFALMAGVSYEIYDQVKAEIGWRYINAGSVRGITTAASPASTTSQLSSQQITVGFRFMID